MSSVALHPVASRSGTQASTQVPINSPSAQYSPSKLGALPGLPRTVSSSSQVGRSPRPRRLPAYGLQVQAEEYPLLSDSAEFPPIRVLTAGEYTQLVDGYEREPLPEGE